MARSKGSKGTIATGGKGDVSEPFEYSLHPRFLQRFLVGLVFCAGAICAAFWLYSAWGYAAVVQPARAALETGTDEGVKEALLTMESPHIFAGYDPYHGFGDDKAPARAERVRGIVGRGGAYSSREERLLVRGIAYYIPAFIEHKINGQVALVGQDRTIVKSLLERWANALRSGVFFAIHATLVSLLFGALFLIYRRFGLMRRIQPLPRAD
jgi:hypothetical protein